MVRVIHMTRSEPTNVDAVDVAGPSDARPIVFVHGAVLTRTMWAPQRTALSDEFRVVAPDLPGHGDRADEEFRLEAAVELIDEVIEERAGGRALLVGLSLGGYASTAYAGRHPEKVDGLVISGSSANPVDSLATLSRAVGGATRLATRSERLVGGFERLAARWVRERDLPTEIEEEIVDAGFYPRQFGVAGSELAGRDFRAAFASYPGPALVLNGERDLVNRRGERRHAGAAENARVKVLEGVGHVCNLHRPAAYTAAVRRFDRRAVADHPDSD